MAEQATLKLQGRGFGISKPASSHLGSPLAGLGRCKGGMASQRLAPAAGPNVPFTDPRFARWDTTRSTRLQGE